MDSGNRLKNKKYDRRTITAYHEAGHALGYFFFHIPFVKVTIAPGPDGSCLGQLVKEAETFRPDWVSPRELDGRVIAALAGMAAEGRYCGKTRWVPYGLDDFDFAFDILSKLEHLDSDDLEAVLRYLWVRTHNLLRRPGHWEAVRQIAQQLISRGELTHNEIASILRPVLQYRIPTWRLMSNACGETAAIHLKYTIRRGLRGPRRT